MSQAVVLAAPRRFEVIERTPPLPGAGEVRLKLDGCGLCSSSLPQWEGRPWFSYPLAPGQPGHEGWGVVEAVGPGVTTVVPGDPVAALAEAAYAQHVVVPQNRLVKLPVSLAGKPFPGEALGCAMNIYRRCDIRSGHNVALVGAGFLGALLIQMATADGARVTAFSRRAWARELALQMGAVAALPLDAAAGKFERVIEAAGKQSTLDLATNLTTEMGRLIIAGYHQDERRVNMQLWNWNGLDVINAHEREPERYLQGIREACAAIEQGRIDPWPLLTHRFPLSEINEAFALAESRPDGVVKVLLCG
jgi:2-desacetyl-2-hydroxyethyl bacteriochlorophyllide A dehydrogenase